MISLTRQRTARAVKSKYRGADKHDKDRELLIAKRDSLLLSDGSIDFSSSYWKLAKNQLKKESNYKCAYCEATTAIVAYGDVEHYRPKSVYWWLAYTYDNYLYSCQICNQAYKKAHFPISSSAFPGPPINSRTTDQEIEALIGYISPDPIEIRLRYTLQEYERNHQSELANLINPYLDNPAEYFAYIFDDVIQEVSIVPREPQYTDQVIAAEEYYGINRVELKNFRYSVFTKFRAFKLAYDALPNSPVKDEIATQIDSMLDDSYVFAGMNRYFNEIL